MFGTNIHEYRNNNWIKSVAVIWIVKPSRCVPYLVDGGLDNEYWSYHFIQDALLVLRNSFRKCQNSMQNEWSKSLYILKYKNCMLANNNAEV